MKKYFFILTITLSTFYMHAQHSLELSHETSFIGGGTFSDDARIIYGIQSIPNVLYTYKIDTLESLDIIAAPILRLREKNMNGMYSPEFKADIYRAWIRYKNKNHEVRLGRQKIDFGQAQILRPVQWFNQRDVRDPLGTTFGVNSLLYRYYFKNNANFWVWGMYGNKDPKGYELSSTSQDFPEFGARFQSPMPRGEVGFTSHFRKESIAGQIDNPEYRFGLDAKWDLTIGLWLEAMVSTQEYHFSGIGEQLLMTLGADYTFAIGNGLNVSIEQMYLNYSAEALLQDNNNTFITAIMASYPIGFFDNVNLIAISDLKNKEFSLQAGYQHDFNHFTSYLIVLYNSENIVGRPQDQAVPYDSGLGFRVLIVFNHQKTFTWPQN